MCAPLLLFFLSPTIDHIAFSVVAGRQHLYDRRHRRREVQRRPPPSRLQSGASPLVFCSMVAVANECIKCRTVLFSKRCLFPSHS